MPQLGLVDRPETFEWNTAQKNQQANALTTPGQRIRLLELAAWVRGVDGFGDVSYRLCVWSQGGNRIGLTSTYDVGPANVNVSNLIERRHDLSTPVELEPNTDIFVGISWSPNGALQTGWHNHGPLSRHVDDESSQLAADLNLSYHSGTGAIGAYVASYEVVAAAWVRRGGTWARGERAQAKRGGTWVDAATVVQVRRGGSWVDAD